MDMKANSKQNIMTLYGKNSVYERLRANPHSIKKIFLQDSFRHSDIEKLIAKNSVPFKRVPSKELSRIKHAKDLQGIVAKTDVFEYADFNGLINAPEKDKLNLIFLDKVQDPQNLGVIIRTISCFGGFALIIGKYQACGVNDTVVHVASGGENYVPVAMVSNLANAIRKAKQKKYWIMGGVVDEGAKSLYDVSLPYPLGLVLGSEGKGIGPGLEKSLDIKAYIPMQGAKLSLNVNIACSVFCYEIARQTRSAKCGVKYKKDVYYD